MWCLWEGHTRQVMTTQACVWSFAHGHTFVWLLRTSRTRTSRCTHMLGSPRLRTDDICVMAMVVFRSLRSHHRGCCLKLCACVLVVRCLRCHRKYLKVSSRLKLVGVRVHMHIFRYWSALWQGFSAEPFFCRISIITGDLFVPV